MHKKVMLAQISIIVLHSSGAQLCHFYDSGQTPTLFSGCWGRPLHPSDCIWPCGSASLGSCSLYFVLYCHLGQYQNEMVGTAPVASETEQINIGEILTDCWQHIQGHTIYTQQCFTINLMLSVSKQILYFYRNMFWVGKVFHFHILISAFTLTLQHILSIQALTVELIANQKLTLCPQGSDFLSCFPRLEWGNHSFYKFAFGRIESN